MTKTAAVELARKGVRVNSIHPGLIETPMADQLGPGVERIVKRTPLARHGQPNEIAGAVIYLLSDAASFTTGTTMVLDGGVTTV